MPSSRARPSRSNLGSDKVLFALLVDEDGNSSPGTMWPERLFEDLEFRIRSQSATSDGLLLKRGLYLRASTLPTRYFRILREPMVQYPMLVRFRELDRPESLEAVAPDALDQAFGAGVKLKRISRRRSRMNL